MRYFFYICRELKLTNMKNNKKKANQCDNSIPPMPTFNGCCGKLPIAETTMPKKFIFMIDGKEIKPPKKFAEVISFSVN